MWWMNSRASPDPAAENNFIPHSSKINLTRRPHLITETHVTSGGDLSHYHLISKPINLMFKPHCGLKERLSIPDICKVPSGALFILCWDVYQAQRRLLNYSISNSHCVVNSSWTQLLVSKASLFHSAQHKNQAAILQSNQETCLSPYFPIH